MILKRSFISLCLLTFLSSASIANAADNGWALPSDDGNNIAGDNAYWGTSKKEDNPESSEWSADSISADSLGKVSKSESDKVPRIRSRSYSISSFRFWNTSGYGKQSKLNK